MPIEPVTQTADFLTKYGLAGVLAILLVGMFLLMRWFISHVVEPVTEAHVGLVQALSANAVDDAVVRKKIEGHLHDIRERQVKHMGVCEQELAHSTQHAKDLKRALE